MCCKWKRIIDQAELGQLSSLDIEKVKQQLQKEKIYEIEVLDRLFELKILNHEEYIQLLKDLSYNHLEHSHFIDDIVELAKDREDYNPRFHYCCCFQGDY